MALQSCVLSLFVTSKCFQVYPASCSDHSWESSTKFSQFPSVYSVRWRPILSFLFFSFSIKLLAVLLIVFCCVIDQSNSSYFLSKIYFFTTPWSMEVFIVRSIKKKKKNQHPQMVFFKVNLWLIHVNVWQKPLQYYKVISLQLIKINWKKK